MKDLKKMPVISELLNDSKHCADFKYLFELYSCGDSSCKFGCEAWREVEVGSAEAALQAELKKRTPLPRMGKDGSFISYEESCKLCENDERDLPSAKESMPKELLAKMKALDKAKRAVFAVSKMVPASGQTWDLGICSSADTLLCSIRAPGSATRSSALSADGRALPSR